MESCKPNNIFFLGVKRGVICLEEDTRPLEEEEKIEFPPTRFRVSLLIV